MRYELRRAGLLWRRSIPGYASGLALTVRKAKSRAVAAIQAIEARRKAAHPGAA